MQVLAIDAAAGPGGAGIMAGGVLRAAARLDDTQGQAARLPGLVDRVLRKAGMAAAALDGVAVTVGPGSFTGLRAALSLAHGLALGAGCALVGVTVREALLAELPGPGGRAVWVATEARSQHVFLDDGDGPVQVALADLPYPVGGVALAGNAASAVAARWAAQGVDLVRLPACVPSLEAVCRVGLARLAGEVPPLAAQPLYVSPPEARLPAGGLRPAPGADP